MPGQLAANTVLRGERVLFVDTEGSFSARRFGALHRALLARQPGGGGADSAAELARDLECLALFRVHDLPQLLQLLAALPARLQVPCSPSMCVQDSHMLPSLHAQHFDCCITAALACLQVRWPKEEAGRSVGIEP